MMKKLLYGLLACGCLSTACQKEDSDDTFITFNSAVVQPAEDFTDPRDGKIYHCIQIGNQIWMTENLCFQTPGNTFNGCYTWGESKAVINLNRATDEEIIEYAGYANISNDEFVELIYDVANDPKNSGKWDETFITKNLPELLMWVDYVPQLNILKSINFANASFYNAVFPLYKALIEERLVNSEEALAAIGAAHFQTAEEENDNKYISTYGFLYSLEGALLAVPDGWRLPTDEDWNTLETTLGMSDEEAQRMNAWRGTGIATLLNEGGESGFNAQKAGGNVYINANDQVFQNKGKGWYYWSSTVDTEDNNDLNPVAIIRMSAPYSNKVWRGTSRLDTGYRDVLYSVRCVKDAN